MLYIGLEAYFEAFMELSTCRDMAFDIGPIPWTAIHAYGERYGYEDEGFEFLLRMIRAMDDAYRTWAKAKTKKSQPQGGGDGKQPGAVQPKGRRPRR